MCGVIVVDAKSFRSTNLGRDAYYNDHSLGYRYDYLIFYQLPNSNLFTHRVLYSWEKPLVKPTAPGCILLIYCFPIYLFPLLFSDLLIQKPKNTLLHFLFASFILCSRAIYLSNLIQTNLFTVERLTTSLTRRVASICSLCAGTVYIVLLGSPTGSITLVS